MLPSHDLRRIGGEAMMSGVIHALAGVAYAVVAWWAVPILWEIDGPWAVVAALAFCVATGEKFFDAIEEFTA